MTGEKNRFSTTEKLWKFNDETLTTPEHDEMVLELLNKEYIRKLIPEIEVFLSATQWWTSIDSTYGIVDIWEKIKQDKKLSDEDGLKIASVKVKNRLDVGFYSDAEKQVIVKVKWETESQSIRDEWNELKQSYKSGEKYMNSHFRDIRISSEVPIMTSKDFIVGYWDVVVDFNQVTHSSKHLQFWYGAEKDKGLRASPVYIEVKPKIASFGATLRQIKTYLEYLPEPQQDSVYLYTRDLRFKDAFESQGIKVLVPLQ